MRQLPWLRIVIGIPSLSRMSVLANFSSKPLASKIQKLRTILVIPTTRYRLPNHPTVPTIRAIPAVLNTRAIPAVPTTRYQLPNHPTVPTIRAIQAVTTMKCRLPNYLTVLPTLTIPTVPTIRTITTVTIQATAMKIRL
jgi:hypothetical protein